MSYLQKKDQKRPTRPIIEIVDREEEHFPDVNELFAFDKRMPSELTLQIT